MLSGRLRIPWGPEPILDAVEAFRGTVTDLSRSLIVNPGSLTQARDGLATKMAENGLSSGDRVVMAVANGPLFIATLAAILSRGGAPLLVHVQTPAAELRRTAVQLGARAIVRDPWPVEESTESLPETKLLSVGSWAEILWYVVDSSDVSFQDDYPSLCGVPLHPTSGTTGVSKIAVRPAYCAMAEAQHYVQTLGVEKNDVFLAVPPMSHAYAYGMCLMVPLLSGASLVTMRRFSAKMVQKALPEHGITIFPAVPVMLDTLLFGAGDRLRNPHRCVLSAGAPLPLRTAEAFQKRAGVSVRSLYGTTETGGISIVAPGDQLASACVGSPMDGVSLELHHSETTTNLGPGVGNLCVRSSSMMAGYLSLGEIDISPLKDGWFETGDLASIDADRRIHLKGRNTDVINVLGMKVIPSEVEEVITTLSGVQEAIVYPGRYRSGSQFVKVAVVGSKQVCESTIRAYCQKNLVYYKRPEVILLVDEFPRSPAGKIVRDQMP